MMKLKIPGHGSLIEALEEWERGWLHLGGIMVGSVRQRDQGKVGDWGR